MTSSMAEPRMHLYEVSPMAQRSASSRFDLPQPFGPTTPVSPGSITISVGSTKDLKPKRRRRVIFTCELPYDVKDSDAPINAQTAGTARSGR